jgi:hypothetical protein
MRLLPTRAVSLRVESLLGRRRQDDNASTRRHRSGCILRPRNSGRRAKRKLHRVSEKAHFTAEEARAAGEQIGIDWATAPFDIEQFRTGMDVELEHGTQDLETNVTDDDATVTAKIARAHLNEFPDYYSRLAVMEVEAEAFWNSQGE